MKTRIYCASLMGIGIMLAAMNTGCALGDRKIALLYKPVTKVEAKSSENIAIVRFKDLRTNPDVGEVRNGYGMKTARVIAEGQDVGAWVANALADELSTAGFQVTKFNDFAPPDITIAITGTVTEAYTKMYFNSTATVRVKVNVTKAGVSVLSKEYSGKHAVLALLVSPGEYEQALQGALQNLMKNLVPDIIEAIK
jgi:hypothetical protein